MVINPAEYIALSRSIARAKSGAVRTEEDIQDDEQEAAMATVKAARRFDPSRGTKFATFAYRRADGAVKDASRRRASRTANYSPVLLESLNGHTPTVDSPHKALENRDLAAKLMEALTDEQRTVVAARVGGALFKDIATSTGIGLKRVTRLYEEAIEVMRVEAVYLGEEEAIQAMRLREEKAAARLGEDET